MTGEASDPRGIPTAGTPCRGPARVLDGPRSLLDGDVRTLTLPRTSADRGDDDLARSRLTRPAATAESDVPTVAPFAPGTEAHARAQRDPSQGGRPPVPHPKTEAGGCRRGLRPLDTEFSSAQFSETTTDLLPVWHSKIPTRKDIDAAGRIARRLRGVPVIAVERVALLVASPDPAHRAAVVSALRQSERLTPAGRGLLVDTLRERFAGDIGAAELRQRLREVRGRLRLDRADMARLLRVSPQRLENLELGRRVLKRGAASRLDARLTDIERRPPVAMLPADWADGLRRAHEVLGLSWAQLSRRIGVSRGTIVPWTRGEAPPLPRPQYRGPIAEILAASAAKSAAAANPGGAS